MMWMLLMAAPFVVLGAVNVAHGPSHPALEETCTRWCHDHGCPHTAARHDFSKPVPALARKVYYANIRALGATPLGYRNTNIVVYVLGAPALAGALLFACLWPADPRISRRRWGVWGAMALAVGLAGVRLGVGIGRLAEWRSLYWFCTDFCIHAANGMGLTYEEFNFLLFVLGFPLTLLGLTGFAARRLLRRSARALAVRPSY